MLMERSSKAPNMIPFFFSAVGATYNSVVYNGVNIVKTMRGNTSQCGNVVIWQM